MATLRTLFLAALMVCASLVSVRGRWEGGLHLGGRTWYIDLDRRSIWNPPAVPTYGQFRSVFDDLPAETTPGLTITRALKWDWMLVDLLLWLWGVTAIFGILYPLARGRRRDPVLHGALCVGAGMTAAAAACFGLWLLIGGWGAPAPELFGLVGVVAGTLLAILTYKPASVRSESQAVGAE
jgi:hypothetical protein